VLCLPQRPYLRGPCEEMPSSLIGHRYPVRGSWCLLHGGIQWILPRCEEPIVFGVSRRQLRLFGRRVVPRVTGLKVVGSTLASRSSDTILHRHYDYSYTEFRKFMDSDREKTELGHTREQILDCYIQSYFLPKEHRMVRHMINAVRAFDSCT
jgi:hypothetical protein